MLSFTSAHSTCCAYHAYSALPLGLALADTHPTYWVAQYNLGLDTLGGVVSDTVVGKGGGGIHVHLCNMVHVLVLRGTGT